MNIHYVPYHFWISISCFSSTAKSKSVVSFLPSYLDNCGCTLSHLWVGLWSCPDLEHNPLFLQSNIHKLVIGQMPQPLEQSYILHMRRKSYTLQLDWILTGCPPAIVGAKSLYIDHWEWWHLSKRNPSDWEIVLEGWKLNLLRIEATLTVIPKKPLDRPFLILVPNLEKDECGYCCRCWTPFQISDWYMASWKSVSNVLTWSARIPAWQVDLSAELCNPLTLNHDSAVTHPGLWREVSTLSHKSPRHQSIVKPCKFA